MGNNKKAIGFFVLIIVMVAIFVSVSPENTYAANKKVTIKTVKVKNTKKNLNITVEINNKTNKEVDFSKDARWIYKKVNGKWKKIKWNYYGTEDVSVIALENSKTKFTFIVSKNTLSENLKKNRTYKLGIEIGNKIRKVKFKLK